MKSILLVKKLLGLAEMTFGLVTASFSLPEGQAVKMIFFARCLKLNRCFLAGDQSTITAEDLEGQFQAIRRLVASKAGFQAFTTLPK